MNNGITDIINNIFANDQFRMVLMYITGVFLGYTLYPVPKSLNTLFNNSTFFKFSILTVSLIANMHPINKLGLIDILSTSAVILVLFQILRLIDKIFKDNKK